MWVREFSTVFHSRQQLVSSTAFSVIVSIPSSSSAQNDANSVSLTQSSVASCHRPRLCALTADLVCEQHAFPFSLAASCISAMGGPRKGLFRIEKGGPLERGSASEIGFCRGCPG